MKKFTLLLLFIACTIITHAQFSFEGGLNMSNLDIKAAGTKVPTQYKAGGSFGMVGGIPFTDERHVYLEIGAFYQTDGAKVTTKPEWTFSLTSITFPINIEYKSGNRCGKRFFAGAGPYIRKNLTGSAYAITAGSNGTVTAGYTDLKIGTDIKATDIGFGINVGYLGRKHWYIRANYMIGTKDNLVSGNDENHVKQTTAGLTIGYVFRNCRIANGWSRRDRAEFSNHWRGIKKLHWSNKSTYHRPNGPGY